MTDLFDWRKLAFDVLAMGLLPLSCLAGGCAFKSDGVHFKGGLGPAGVPVLRWHVDTGTIDAAVEVMKFAEIPPDAPTPP